MLSNKKFILLVEHLPVTFIFLLIGNNYDVNYIGLYTILFFGWLIDADHLIDYLFYIIKKKRAFSFSFFLSGKYFKENQKIIVILHAYEISVLLLYFGYLSGNNTILLCGFAHLAHIIQDQFTNNVNKLAYFISYRIFVKFKYQIICK